MYETCATKISEDENQERRCWKLFLYITTSVFRVKKMTRAEMKEYKLTLYILHTGRFES